jgi:hypothetical protein
MTFHYLDEPFIIIVFMDEKRSSRFSWGTMPPSCRKQCAIIFVCVWSRGPWNPEEGESELGLGFQIWIVNSLSTYIHKGTNILLANKHPLQNDEMKNLVNEEKGYDGWLQEKKAPPWMKYMTIFVKALIETITCNIGLMCECANFLVWLTFMITTIKCVFPKKS